METTKSLIFGCFLISEFKLLSDPWFSKSIPDQDAEKLKADFQILKTIPASHSHSRSRPSSSRSDVLDEENRTKPDYVPVEIAG